MNQIMKQIMNMRLPLLAVVAASGLQPVATALAAQPTALSTQQSTARTISRTIGARLGKYSVLGAAAGAALGFGYYFMSEQGNRAGGCRPFSCAMPFLVFSGTLSGLFMASELNAQRRAETPRAGEQFAFAFSEAGVLSAPNAIDVRDSLIAVVSDSGAQLLSAAASPKALRRRASGLANLRQVVIVPRAGTVVLGTGTALWEASLTTGPASRIDDGPIDALAASDDAVLSASGRRVQWRRGQGPTARRDSIDLPTSVSALAFDSQRDVWWAGTDSLLVQILASDAGLRLGVTLAVPGPPRSITTDGEWVAAALGDEGIIAWPRVSLTAATAPVRLVREPRFAYDLAFLNGTLFVAGGVDGLYRVSLSPSPTVLGSSRQFPFATTVRAANGVVWVGDRVRKSVVRVTP